MQKTHPSVIESEFSGEEHYNFLVDGLVWVDCKGFPWSGYSKNGTNFMVSLSCRILQMFIWLEECYMTHFSSPCVWLFPYIPVCFDKEQILFAVKNTMIKAYTVVAWNIICCLSYNDLYEEFHPDMYAYISFVIDFTEWIWYNLHDIWVVQNQDSLRILPFDEQCKVSFALNLNPNRNSTEI